MKNKSRNAKTKNQRVKIPDGLTHMDGTEPLSALDERIAQYAAQGVYTRDAIAKRENMGRFALDQRLRSAGLQERIKFYRQKFAEEIFQQHIADKNARMAEYDRRWKSLLMVIEARASDPRSKKFPGGETGLLAIYPIKLGKDIVQVAEVDTGLLGELRQLEKQAAIEAGQWEEKKQIEMSGRDGKPMTVNVLQYPMDEMARLLGVTVDATANLPESSGSTPGIPASPPDATSGSPDERRALPAPSDGSEDGKAP